MRSGLRLASGLRVSKPTTHCCSSSPTCPLRPSDGLFPCFYCLLALFTPVFVPVLLLSDILVFLSSYLSPRPLPPALLFVLAPCRPSIDAVWIGWHLWAIEGGVVFYIPHHAARSRWHCACAGACMTMSTIFLRNRLTTSVARRLLTLTVRRSSSR